MLEVNRDQWAVLRDLYQNDRMNLTGYDLLNSYINCVEYAENVKLFATDDNWREHGSFVLIDCVGTKADVYFNTLNASVDELQLALSSLKLNVRHVFCGYRIGFKKLIEAYWLGRLLKMKRLEHQGTFVYHLPRSAVKPFADPAHANRDVMIGFLHSENAAAVDEQWPYRSSDSLPLIRDLIKHNIQAGVFDYNDKLLAWCLRSHHGSLSHLYVLPAYRRRGLGSLLVRYMAQEINAAGAEVLTTIEFSNEGSRKLFEKLGFKHVDNLYWAIVPSA